MNPENILRYCDEIDVRTQAIRDEVLTRPQPPDATVVQEGEDLQAALDAGGRVTLADGATFTTPGGYALGTGAHLEGALNGIGGDTGPALHLAPGVHRASAARLTVQSDSEVVVRVGRNDGEQVTVEDAPRGIHFGQIASLGHRGKRCFEINGGDIWLDQCDVRDSYDPENQDSQAICVLNAPGPVSVLGGYFEGASETFMVGGDTMKIPHCRPTGILLRDAHLTKHAGWQAAGTKVKNILELKDGHDVLIERCTLWLCWKSAQDGYCFMFTPRNGGSLRNVVVRDCTVFDVGGIVNITGADGANPRTQVAIVGGTYRTNVATMGSQGRFALITGGPESFNVEGAVIAHEGPSFIDCADQGHVDLLRVVGSTWNYGTYGIRVGGYSHGEDRNGLIGTFIVEGNTISGAHSSFQTRFPHNTYVGTYAARHETPYRDDEVALRDAGLHVRNGEIRRKD